MGLYLFKCSFAMFVCYDMRTLIITLRDFLVYMATDYWKLGFPSAQPEMSLRSAD